MSFSKILSVLFLLAFVLVFTLPEISGLVITAQIFMLLMTLAAGAFLFIKGLRLKRFRWLYLIIGLITFLAEPYYVVAGYFLRYYQIDIIPDFLAFLFAVVLPIIGITLLFLYDKVARIAPAAKVA